MPEEAEMLEGLADVLLDEHMGARRYACERVFETVNDDGRAIYSTEPGEFAGNIQPASGQERELLEEGDLEKADIVIFTPESLSAGEAPGPDGTQRRADRIFYQGAPYRVRKVEDWQEQAGFARALAVLERKHA